MDIVSITIVLRKVADEVILHTNIVNAWPKILMQNDTINLVYVVPSGVGVEHCKTYFAGIPYTVRVPKEWHDPLIEELGVAA